MEETDAEGRGVSVREEGGGRGGEMVRMTISPFIMQGDRTTKEPRASGGRWDFPDDEARFYSSSDSSS